MKQIKANLFSATRSVVQRGTVAILCTFIFGLFLIVGCKKDDPAPQGGGKGDTYYIIGYDVQSGVDIENETGKAGTYLFVSENLKDTLMSCNFPDNFFTFSSEIVKPINICGFNLFPEEYRLAYKVQLTYRLMTEEELEEASYICLGLWPVLYNIQPIGIFITSISTT